MRSPVRSLQFCDSCHRSRLPPRPKNKHSVLQSSLVCLLLGNLPLIGALHLSSQEGEGAGWAVAKAVEVRVHLSAGGLNP